VLDETSKPCCNSDRNMKVRLTRKHADWIDGIDLSHHKVGDIVDLTPNEARLLIAEQWAHPDRRVVSTASAEQRRAADRVEAQRSKYPEDDARSAAADQPPRGGESR
jgi:hypothetical protein